MVWTRRSMMSIAAVAAAVAAAVLGVSTAIAQDDGAARAVNPGALLERLDAIEVVLPAEVAPTDVTLDEETTWGTYDGDATSLRAVLDTVEPDLRELYVDADDADGGVADAVSLVARGWLDVWTGAASISAAETHDLAFPLNATDDLGVAAGADELRGAVEVGLDLILLGRARHLEGYTALQALNAAETEAQLRLDERARAAVVFDEQRRPDIVALLSRPTSSVLVATERFATDAPGVRSRATAVTLVCVDRDALDAVGGVATPEALAQLDDDDITRDDCPALPEPLDD